SLSPIGSGCDGRLSSLNRREDQGNEFLKTLSNRRSISSTEFIKTIAPIHASRCRYSLPLKNTLRPNHPPTPRWRANHHTGNRHGGVHSPVPSSKKEQCRHARAPGRFGAISSAGRRSRGDLYLRAMTQTTWA